MRTDENSLKGIDDLRKMVNNASYCGEYAFEGLTAVECVLLLTACRAEDLEVMPDQLDELERKYAAKHGRLSVKCRRRLYKAAA